MQNVPRSFDSAQMPLFLMRFHDNIVGVTAALRDVGAESKDEDRPSRMEAFQVFLTVEINWNSNKKRLAKNVG